MATTTRRRTTATSKKASGRSGSIEALRRENAELRRRIAIIEELPPASFLDDPVEGAGGDVIRRPLLHRAFVLAALHGDISQEQWDQLKQAAMNGGPPQKTVEPRKRTPAKRTPAKRVPAKKVAAKR